MRVIVAGEGSWKIHGSTKGLSGALQTGRTKLITIKPKSGEGCTQWLLKVGVSLRSDSATTRSLSAVGAASLSSVEHVSMLGFTLTLLWMTIRQTLATSH